MNKSFIYIITGVLIVIAIGIVIYIVATTSTTTTSNSASGTSQTTTPGSVAIRNFAFAPSTITVHAGDTVTWTNNDSIIHRVAADDGSFDLGDQSNSIAVKHTFTKTGTYNYHCTIHPSMKGVVIVD